MEFIMEILFEVIVEGALEASSDKKIPLPVRVIAAIITVGIYGGLIGFCLYSYFQDGNPTFLIVGIIILGITVLGAISIYRRRR